MGGEWRMVLVIEFCFFWFVLNESLELFLVIFDSSIGWGDGVDFDELGYVGGFGSVCCLWSSLFWLEVGLYFS